MKGDWDRFGFGEFVWSNDFGGGVVKRILGFY